MIRVVVVNSIYLYQKNIWLNINIIGVYLDTYVSFNMMLVVWFGSPFLESVTLAVLNSY